METQTSPICPILFAYELTMLREKKGKMIWLIRENRCMTVREMAAEIGIGH